MLACYSWRRWPAALACRGKYNMVLTGSAFMDARRYFPLYRHARGRDTVDELFNCEDVLMNHVVAQSLRAGTEGAPVHFVRPRLRIDISVTERALPPPPSSFPPLFAFLYTPLCAFFSPPTLFFS